MICTIHQPASEIFASFDTLALMHLGGSAYFGSASEAVSYFATLGYVCPNNYNPGDFLVSLLMRQLQDMPDATVNKLASGEAGSAFVTIETSMSSAHTNFIEAWTGVASSYLEQPTFAADCSKPLSFVQEEGASIMTQFLLIAKRNLIQFKREKLGVRVRAGQTLFFTVLVGLVFYDLDLGEASIQDRSGLIFFACLSQFIVGMQQVVLMFPIEASNHLGFEPRIRPYYLQTPTDRTAACLVHEQRRIFKREHAAGYYTVPAYFFAKVFSESPFQVVFPLAFGTILTIMTGLQRGRIWTFLGVLVLITNCAAALGFVIGSIAPTPQIAVVLAPPFQIASVLVSGLLANKERIHPYFAWLETISFLSWGYEACMISEFTGLEFKFNTTLIIVDPSANMESGLANRSHAVRKLGEEVLETMGFDGSIQGSLIALAMWYVSALAVALVTLSLQVNARKYRRNAWRVSRR